MLLRAHGSCVGGSSLQRARRGVRQLGLVKRAAVVAPVVLVGFALAVAIEADRADASLGELTFLGCIGQASLSQCSAVPSGLTGVVEEPKGIAVSPDGTNVYAADDDASAIDVFARNLVDGTLTLTSCVGQHTGCATTSPQLKAVERPFAVAVSPDGRNVYAVSVGSNTIDEFARNAADGELTYTGCIGRLAGCTPTSPAEAIDGPASIAISADGTSVYVASENAGGAVDEFQRNTSNGTLTFERCVGAGGCVVPSLPEALRLADAVVVSPDGENVYVSGQGASISTFARDASNGELTFQGCVGNDNECVQPNPLAINEPTSLAISPDGANLYAGNFANGVVDVLARNTTSGALTFAGCDGALSGEPGACTEMPSGNPAGPLTVAISPEGADLYVAAEQGVYEYARGSAGALVFAACTGNQPGVCTATVPEEALSFSVSLALSPNGASLYAGTELAKDLDVFGRETLPTCANITTTTPYETAITLKLSCGDADGKPVTLAVAGSPTHGSLGTLGAGGEVTYTPAAGFSGPDSFSFTAQNEDGTSSPASVTITVGSPTNSTAPGQTTITTAGNTPGIATTAQAVEELLLACTKRPLVLNDVLAHGDRVLLEGSAANDLRGKKVEIVFDGHEHVATATIAADGEFSTSAPLPPARLRDSNSARYMAVLGSQRSLDLKLTRRLILEPPKFSGGTVALVGQVLPPLPKPVASVSVRQQLECGKATMVGTFKPSRDGRFHITLKVPASAKAALYTLMSTIVAKPGTKHGFATYSLPLPVLLG
jgi:DNA-binding beta-propeller fold protein YncE